MNIHDIWPEWTIEEEIGKGSFGTVYRIRKGTGPGAIYSALKVIRIPASDSVIDELLGQGMDRESIRRMLKNDAAQLENEIKVMISLKSSINIVSIEDYKIVPEGMSWHFFICMELLESVSGYAKRNKGLSRDEVVQLGIDISNALKSCEKAGIIHRDVKPANIFRNREGAYKLGDFGIAKQMHDRTAAYTRIGTPSFEAPEILLGKKYNHTVDIYALGTILYTYLNRGRKPYMPPHPKSITQADIETATERRLTGYPLEAPPGTPAELAKIVLKACKFQPEQRYQHAQDLREDLISYQRVGRRKDPGGTETVSPGKDSSGKKNSGKKTPVLRRAFIILALAAVVVAGIIAGYLLSTDDVDPDSKGATATTSTPKPAATSTPKPAETSSPKPTATSTPQPEETKPPASDESTDAEATLSALYPDGNNVAFTSASYNSAAPDWTEYDNLITEIKSEIDPEARRIKMHKAEDILMATGAVIPIYYYNDMYLQKIDVNEIYSNEYGYKYFMFASSPRQVLRVNLSSEPYSIDPAISSSIDAGSIDINLFSGLLSYNYMGDLESDLAEIYEVSQDGLKYTFHLQEGLKWSDGTPLTANDFVYSWKRAADPKTGADYAYLFECIAGYEDNDLQVEAPDDLTLTVTLNAPCAYFLDLVAHPVYFPVPQSSVETAYKWESVPDSWATEAGFVTNGAYTVSEWIHDESMTLTKNPNYHRADEVSVEQIVIVLSDDDSALYDMYQEGNLDFTDTVPVNEFETIKNSYDLHIVDNLGTYFAAFNVNSPLFQGKTVEQANAMRKAFSLLVDRWYIIDNIGLSGQNPATSFIPIGMADGCGSEFKINSTEYTFPYSESIGYYPEGWTEEGVNEARILLEYAGFEFDEDGMLSDATPISFTYLTNDSTGNVAIAEALQQDFTELGIEMSIESLEWNTFLDERRNGNFDMAREGWIADYNDPINMLEIWTSDSWNNDCQFGKNT